MAVRKEDIAAGVVVRRLRETAGITQVVLAEELAISYTQVQKYESGQNRISLSRLFDISRILGQAPHVIVQLVEFELKAQKDFKNVRPRKRT